MPSRRSILTLTLLVGSQLWAPGSAAAQTTPPADQAPAAAPAPTPAPDTATTPPVGAPDVATTAPKSKMGEEIVVTGSRIRRKELTTPAPVAVIGREQIQASGYVSIGDFLQSIPEQGNALNTTINNGGDGSTQISLRGLGSQRTLVLVDGKRFITGVPGGGNLNDPGADMNAIPTAAIERIEILKDGASAVYGSDAIGGVINIITRKRVNGVEASATGQTSQHGDASIYDINLLGGATGDRGSFSFGTGYYKQESIFASQRDWAKESLLLDYSTGELSGGGSSRIPQGRALVDPSTCTTPLCAGLLSAYGAGKANFLPTTKAIAGSPFVTDPLTGLTWRKYDGSDAYPFQGVNYLITPSQRFSLYSNGEYNLNSNARAYFHATFVNRQSSNAIAPEPLDTGSFGVVYSAANQYNPFGIDLHDARRRLYETGNRSQAFDLDTFQMFTGVDGTLPSVMGPLAGWAYDVSFGYARNNVTQTTNGSLNTERIGAAIGPSRDGVCYSDATFATPVANCTPANWFTGDTGRMTPAMVTGMGGFIGPNHGMNQMTTVEANVNGELFSLMASRPVSLGLGYAYRNEFGFFEYNPNAVAGIDTDYNGNNTRGGYYVNEGYAELSMPIISNMVGVEDLELQAALRYSNFNTFGDTATWKFGARYRPIRDVTLRGTYSKGYRAPGITALYGGTGPSAEYAVDPCGTIAPGNTALAQQCAQQLKRGGGGAIAVNNADDNDQLLSTVGGNAQLKPEKADIFTAGVVLEPRMVKGLAVTADFYSVKITQAIDFVTTAVALAGCYPGAGGTPNQALCDLIQRDPANGHVRDVTDIITNVGETFTQGLDLAARYSLPTPYGRFTFSGDSTFLFKYDKTLASGQVIKGVGTYDLGVNPSVKWNLGAAYNLAGFQANVIGRFIGSYHECATYAGSYYGASSGSGLCYLNPVDPDGKPFPVHEVGVYSVFDLNLSYTTRWSLGQTTIAAGIRNLFNTDPPGVYNAAGSTNSDPYTYDYMGRAFYAQIVQRFL